MGFIFLCVGACGRMLNGIFFDSLIPIGSLALISSQLPFKSSNSNCFLLHCPKEEF